MSKKNPGKLFLKKPPAVGQLGFALVSFGNLTKFGSSSSFFYVRLSFGRAPAEQVRGV